MKIRKLSIIVPVLNEIQTVKGVYKKLKNLKVGAPREVIFVDDGSTDGTSQFLRRMKATKPRGFIFLSHPSRMGKGTAVQTGLRSATGSHIAIQDADNEYEPAELKKLVSAAKTHSRAAIFGSRNREIKNKYIYPTFYWGSKLLAYLVRTLYGYNLTDPETCQKLIPASAMKSFALTERGFGIEIEMITNIAQQKLKVFEVPITYNPRSFEEGKKIRASDGIHAIYLLFRLRFFPKRRPRRK